MIGLQNKTRYISYRDTDAPQVQNSYGTLTNLLRTVLTIGFNFNTIESFTLVDDFHVNILLKSGHGFQEESVVKISGTGDELFDDCFRVLALEGNTITIGFSESVVSVPEITETTSICTAPLGYEIVFENEAKTTVCFENKSVTSKGILKVIDELPPNGYSTGWTKYARVAVGKEIDSSGNFINDVKAPFHPNYPDSENTGNGASGSSGIHGYAKWYYAFHTTYYSEESRAPDGSFPRKWELIGDDKTFYLLLYNTNSDNCNCGFGSYYNQNNNGGLVLQASDGFISASTRDDYKYGKKRAYWGTLINSSTGSFVLPNDFFNQKTSRYYGAGLFLGSNNKAKPWQATDIQNYNPFTGLMTTSKLYIRGVDGFLYGYHRGLDIFYGSDHPKEGRLLGTTYRIINMTDPLRSGSDMPLMFNMQDWEDV